MLTRTQVEAVNCTKDRTYVIFMYECLLIRRPRNSAVIFFRDCLGTRLSKTEAVLILLYVRLISFSVPIFVEHCGLLATFSGCYACQSSWYHLLWVWFALIKPRTRYAVAFRCRCACIHPGHPRTRLLDDKHHRRKEGSGTETSLLSRKGYICDVTVRLVYTIQPIIYPIANYCGIVVTI